MKDLARKNIRKIRPYEPGKPIEELQRESGIKDIIKLASNENPLGPCPKAVRAMSKAISTVNRYPDGSSYYLRKKIASKNGLGMENVIIGCGSDELIDMVTKAFLEDKDEVLIAKPAFLEYFILSKSRGVKVKEVRLKNFQYDIKSLLSAINKKTKVIFLGNPDNPTGAYFTKGTLSDFMKKCPTGKIVVFDEAYRELVNTKDYSDPITYIDTRNVIVLRTFSKAYGLAGLRIGYGFANKDIISSMEKVRLPFNVNLLAQRAALAAMDDKSHLVRTNRVLIGGKKFLVKKLRELGFNIVVSPANFILVRYGRNKGYEIFKKLLRYGVIVRDMKAYGLPDYFRVNVGTMRENRRFIEALKKIM